MTIPSHPKTMSNPAMIGFSGNLLTVSATEPLPPGSRVELDLALGDDTKSLTLRGKVVSISSQAGGYQIRVRLHGLTREQIQALHEALSRMYT